MPYVRQPEELIPGRPLFYATATHAERRGQRRPGGEPRRPAHQDRRQSGASRPRWARCDPFSQASVLQLYDPDRSQALTFEGEIRSLGRLSAAPCASCWRSRSASNGAGIRILTETVTSPTMADQLRGHPEAVSRRQVAPVGAGRAAQRARRAPCRPSAQPVNTYYDLANADVVVSLDSDFLASGAGQPALRAPVRRRAGACSGGQTSHEPAVRGGADAHAHRRQGRPPAAAARRRYRGVRLGAGHRRWASPTARRKGDNGDIYKWIGRIAQDLQAQQGRQPGDRRRVPAAHRARPGARHERQAGQRGQDGVLHRPDRSQPGGPAGVAAGPGEGSGCGRGGPAADPGRQPGLQRAGGAGHARPHPKGRAARAPEPVRRRDLRGLPVAPAGNALPGNLGRCARLRRHRHHPAAADPAALRRPLGVRGAADAHRRSRRRARTRSSRATGPRSTPGADFEAWWRRAVHDGVVAGYGAARQDARDARRGHHRAAREKRRLGGKLEVDLPARSRPSTTAASPTTAGCRNCPSRSPSSPGTTPPS